ncbi:MAG: flagellar motor protein MotB [Caulobacterales bacterium 32-69-10]|nr:MAG: flagellar motor protein MotB [Caulobacterales bacterium 32-69-10]
MVLKQAKPLAIVAVALLASSTLGACATKGFVRQEVGAVDTKLTTTQGQVTAQGDTLNTHGTQIAELDKTSREALERATAAGKLAEGKFVYQLVLSDDSIKFPVDRAKLSAEAETRLLEFSEKLKADNKNVYLEIQGHTDATGGAEYNEKLGAERAEAVRVFLNKHGVPLNRMASISYGAGEPVAPNNTRTGRAQNRRVVVVVLA